MGVPLQERVAEQIEVQTDAVMLLKGTVFLRGPSSPPCIHNSAMEGRRPVFLAICVCVLAGCQAPRTVTVAPASQLPRVLETESQMLRATEGLDFSTGAVTIARRVKRDPEAAKSLLTKAERALVSENLAIKSVGLFRDAILADPRLVPAYVGLARAALFEGEPKIARAALRTALAIEPSCADALFQLGTVAQMEGDYTTAVQTWQTLVAIEPDYPDAFARMAIACYFDQRIDLSARYLEQADKRGQRVPPQFRKLMKEQSK